MMISSPFSSHDGVAAGDGGVFKMIRFGASALSVVGGSCFCLALEMPNVTSIVSFGIVELAVFPGEFMLITSDLKFAAPLSLLLTPSEEEKSESFSFLQTPEEGEKFVSDGTDEEAIWADEEGFDVAEGCEADLIVVGANWQFSGLGDLVTGGDATAK